MADATYFERCQSSFTLLHGPQQRRISFSLIIPNAPRHGPPTSSPVQVNLESSVAVTNGFRPTELEARLHSALTTIEEASRVEVNIMLHRIANLFGYAWLEKCVFDNAANRFFRN